jgi:hypothetical protein
MPDRISILLDFRKSISMNYSLFPIITSKHCNNFSFMDQSNFRPTKDKNKAILVLGKYFTILNKSEKNSLIYKLKNEYERVIFFDDLDGTEIQFFEHFDHFDLYFKKQVYSDISNYLKDFVGNKAFTDYYAKHYGVLPIKPSNYNGQYKGGIKNLTKIKVAWNIGLGIYNPSHGKLREFLFQIFGITPIRFIQKQYSIKRPNTFKDYDKCQARFFYNPARNHIDFQRKLFLEKTSQHPSFLSGAIDPLLYTQEIKKVKAVLSPFGFGEVCFRDFEAVLNGAILIKPEMDHITTWPNIYKPNETYIPIKWDASDLIEKVEYLLQNPKEFLEMSQFAFELIQQAFEEKDLKVEEMIENINSK